MHKILLSEQIAPEVQRIKIEAPRIARRRKPGQFIVLRIREGGERIPLTIVDSDPALGTITLIVQGIGKSTKECIASGVRNSERKILRSQINPNRKGEKNELPNCAG